MSKAPDSANHGVLLAKLQDIGAPSTVIEWGRSYLSSRYQAVKINTTLSDRLPASCGVPHGSILGPLLFNIYMNDLPSTFRSCSAQCYMDDTKLLISFKFQHIESYRVNGLNLRES